MLLSRLVKGNTQPEKFNLLNEIQNCFIIVIKKNILLKYSFQLDSLINHSHFD